MNCSKRCTQLDYDLFDTGTTLDEAIAILREIPADNPKYTDFHFVTDGDYESIWQELHGIRKDKKEPKADVSV